MNSEYGKEFGSNTHNKEEPTYGHYIPKDERMYGKCTLQIRFENYGQYLQWRKYNGGKNRWDFAPSSWPAIMRAEYDFHTGTDVDVMVRKIIQLLQMGFNVRAVDWKLTEFKSQLEK